MLLPSDLSPDALVEMDFPHCSNRDTHLCFEPHSVRLHHGCVEDNQTTEAASDKNAVSIHNFDVKPLYSWG